MITPEEKMRNLLKLIGNVSECNGCKSVIVWVATKFGKKMPLNPDGVQHWATCPQAREFKKNAAGASSQKRF